MNLIFEHNYFTYLLILLNLSFFFISSLDWDTSNHLYEAKLRNKKVIFKSSYKIGIKIFNIKLYQIFWTVLKKNLKLFRVFTFISFILTFVYVYHITPEISQRYIILITYFFFISFYNPQTSATEFYSTLVILFVFNFPNEEILTIYAGAFFILLNSLLFKNLEILYIIPYFFFFFFEDINIQNIDSLFLFLIFSFVILLILLCLKKMKYFRDLFHYFVNRSFKKSKNFFLKNFYIILPLIYWIFDLYLFVEFNNKILIFTYIIVFFIQRGLTSYFYYPLFILSFFVSIKTNYFLYNEHIFQILTIVTFASFIFTSILNIFFRDYDITFRILNNWNLFIIKEKFLEKKLIQFITDNIRERYYFWGSKILIPLKITNDQLIDQYYSHNHLLLWKEGNIEKKYKEIDYFFNTQKPKYIIESGTINNFKINSNILKKYKIIFSNEIGKVYEKI